MRKIRKNDVGRWCSVKWDCVGRKDSLLVEVDLENKWGKVFEPFSGLTTICLDQITELRGHQKAA